MNQTRPGMLVPILVLQPALGTAWATWAGSGAGVTPVAPASAAPITIPWSHVPTPDCEMAAPKHSYTHLLSRDRQYRKYLRAYQSEINHCQSASPPDRASKDSEENCSNPQQVQCLDPARNSLERAPHGVHDQAIALEWAMQQLAGKTE